jgi:hypothetical protein
VVLMDQFMGCTRLFAINLLFSASKVQRAEVSHLTRNAMWNV